MPTVLLASRYLVAPDTASKSSLNHVHPPLCPVLSNPLSDRHQMCPDHLIHHPFVHPHLNQTLCTRLRPLMKRKTRTTEKDKNTRQVPSVSDLSHRARSITARLFPSTLSRTCI